MDILIVDDYPQKYKRVLEELDREGIEIGNFEVVQNAIEARQKLESNFYDLMVIDINLPLRSVDSPSYQHSIELIQEILDTNAFNKPGQIVGITADAIAAKKASPIFNERLWAIISYSEFHDEWLSQIINCISYINSKRIANIQIVSKVDLVIICALADPELSEVLKLPWNFSSARPLDDMTFVYDGAFISEGQKFTVMALSTARMGMISTALVASKIIETVRPKVMVMTGICAGIKKKTNLGDVIFADPTWDWQCGKYIRDAENSLSFAISPHQISAPYQVRTHIEQLRADKSALLEISSRAPIEEPGPLKIVIGPVASGSAVIANQEIVIEITQQHRDVSGVEMECYGLYAAAEAASEPRPLTFALKGVCDFADPHKNDNYQRCAAYTSAEVMKLLFERYAKRLMGSR